MSKKVLSINIQENIISAVLVDYGLKGIQVINSLCLNFTHTQTTTEMSEILKEKIADISEQMGDAYDKCILSIPAKNFFFRTIELPFKSRKNINNILAFELEPLLPCPMEDISIDFNILVKNSRDSSDSSKIIAASIQNKHIKLYKAIFDESKIHPDVVTVGSGYSSANAYAEKNNILDLSFFIHLESTFAALYALKAGEIIFVRIFLIDYDDPVLSVKKNILRSSLAYNEIFRTNEKVTKIIVSGSTGQSALDSIFEKDAYSKDLNIEIIAVDFLKNSKIGVLPELSYDQDHNFSGVQNAIAMGIVDIKGLDYFNFSKKISGVELFFNENRYSIITSMILFILLLFSMTISPVIKTHAMEKRISLIDARITDIFKSSFPEIHTIVDPVQQMQVHIEALKKQEKLDLMKKHPLSVDLLQSISSALPDNLDITFSRFVRTETNLIISGTTDKFNTVDNMKSDLSKIKFFKSVEINSASMDKASHRVKFNLKILL